METLLRSCTREAKPVVSWNPCSKGYYPSNAVKAGVDCNDTIYVARGWHKGALIPGQLHVGFRYGTIPYEGKEVPCKSYEILLAPPGVLKWVTSSKGERVEGAVIGGFTEDGEDLFVGRLQICGTSASGSIQPSRKCLVVPWTGTVRKTCTHCYPYEILVVDEKYRSKVMFKVYTGDKKSCWPKTMLTGSGNVN